MLYYARCYIRRAKKEIIGIWIGENETSKYWLTVLNDIKKRGIEDVLIFAIDGLNGFNEAIKAVYSHTEIQRCIVHSLCLHSLWEIRSSLKFVSWKDKKAVAKDLKSAYSAHNEEDAQLALTEFNDIWGNKYPNYSLLAKSLGWTIDIFQVSWCCSKIDLYCQSYRIFKYNYQKKNQILSLLLRTKWRKKVHFLPK